MCYDFLSDLVCNWIDGEIMVWYKEYYKTNVKKQLKLLILFDEVKVNNIKL